MFKSQKGMSVIEVVLAAAIFVIFASSAVRSLLQNYSANRTGAEYTVASQFASEGLEAVRSIRNQSIYNLVNSNGTGVVRTGNLWAFGGAINTLAHNSSDNYIRTIRVEDVNRSGVPPLGNIISPGGTLDLNTKKITSTVSWNFSTGRPETMSLVTYLSDWKKQIAGDGVIVYGDTTAVTQPRYRLFTDSTNTFAAETSIGTFAGETVGKTFKIKTSPIRQEALIGYVNNAGTLKIMCYDGSRWTTEWSVAVGGNGSNAQRFGIAYETFSGDALIVYSKNVPTNNEMGYRTKPGTTGCGTSNWVAEAPINPVQTSGIVHWIRLESNPLSSSNNIAVAWADSNSDLSAMQWNGTAFGIIPEPAAPLENNLEVVSIPQDVQSFDIAYESLSGNLMVVWGPGGATCVAGSTCIKYARYTSSWSTPAGIPAVADFVTSMDISSNPSGDQIVIGAIDNVSLDLSIAYWSGLTWTGFANVDTATAAPAAGNKMVATGWLVNGATTRYVVVYNDSGTNNIGWYVGGPTFTSLPAPQADFPVTPVFANPQSWYDIQMDPLNKDRLMLTVADSASDLSAKRLVMTAVPVFTWTNSNGATALETGLGQATTGPYGFAYWRNHQ